VAPSTAGRGLRAFGRPGEDGYQGKEQADHVSERLSVGHGHPLYADKRQALLFPIRFLNIAAIDTRFNDFLASVGDCLTPTEAYQ
jgi:hypothetical protein